MKRVVVGLIATAVIAATVAFLRGHRSRESEAIEGSAQREGHNTESSSAEMSTSKNVEVTDRIPVEVGSEATRTADTTTEHRKIVVVRPSGDPVAGAVVQAIVSNGGEAIPSPDDVDAERQLRSLVRGSGTTDEAGTVDLIVPKERFLLSAKARGFQPTCTWFDTGIDACRRIVVCEQVGFKGTVLSASTKATIDGAQLVAFPRVHGDAESADSRLMRLAQAEWATSKGDGRFSFWQVPTENLTVECDVSGFPRLRSSLVPEGQQVTFEVGGDVRSNGVVVDELGAPIPHAKVSCALRGQLPITYVGRTESNEDGSFLLEGLPTGDVMFAAWADRYSMVKELRRLETGKEEYVEITLVPSAPVHGSVVDEDRKPVPGVFLQFYDRTQDCEACYVTTEADGTFGTVSIHPKHRLDAIMQKDGWAWTELFDIVPDNEPKTFVICKLGRVSGRIVDPEGKPIQKFSIRDLDVSTDLNLEYLTRISVDPKQFDSPDGSFVLDGEYPLARELEVQAEGFARKTARIDEVPRRGATIGPYTIRLDRGLTIHGRVVDELGRPRVGVSVGLPSYSFAGQALQPAAMRCAYTTSTGEFDLADVPTGLFDLLIGNYDTGHELQRDLRASDFPRDLTLGSTGVIEGRLLTPWRSPSTVTTVRVFKIGEWLGCNANVRANGEFSYHDLTPGDYEVSLFDQWVTNEAGGGDSRTSVVATVRAGETTHVELDDQGGGCVFGSVVGPPGLTCLGNRMTVAIVRASDRRRVAFTPLCANGRFRVGGVSTGQYSAVVESDSRGLVLRGEQAFELTSLDRPAEVEVRLSDQSVDGIVDGVPDGVADVEFIADAGGRVATTMRTAFGGSYRALVEPPGRYVVHVSAPGFADDYSVVVDVPRPADAALLHHHLAIEAVLELTVVDDCGDPIQEATVALAVAGTPTVASPITARTDGRGQLRITRLPAGRSMLTVTKSGHVPVVDSAVHFDPGATRKETVKLVRSASLIVQFRPSAGSRTNSVTVGFQRATGGEADGRSAIVSKDEPVRWSDLAPGEYQMIVDGGAPESVELHAGELLKLTIGERSH